MPVAGSRSATGSDSFRMRSSAVRTSTPYLDTGSHTMPHSEMSFCQGEGLSVVVAGAPAAASILPAVLPRVAELMLSSDLWTRQFGSDDRIVRRRGWRRKHAAPARKL